MMKLSEAIIRGCEGTYQIRRMLTNSAKGYCAIGTAIHAVGIKDADIICIGRSGIGRLFPIVKLSTVCPETGLRENVLNICGHLNDKHDWPRLSIAEWLANVVEPEFEK